MSQRSRDDRIEMLKDLRLVYSSEEIATFEAGVLKTNETYASVGLLFESFNNYGPTNTFTVRIQPVREFGLYEFQIEGERIRLTDGIPNPNQLDILDRTELREDRIVSALERVVDGMLDARERGQTTAAND